MQIYFHVEYLIAENKFDASHIITMSLFLPTPKITKDILLQTLPGALFSRCCCPFSNNEL